MLIPATNTALRKIVPDVQRLSIKREATISQELTRWWVQDFENTLRAKNLQIYIQTLAKSKADAAFQPCLLSEKIS